MILHLLLPLIMLVLGLLCVVGCGTIREIPVQTVEKVIVRDSLIYVTDSIIVEVPKEVIKEIVPQDTVSILKTSVATSQAKVEKGMLTHTLEQKGVIKTRIDTVFQVQYVDRIIEKDVPIEVEVIKYKRDTIFWFSIIFNILVLVFIGFRIYLKLKI